MLSLLTLAFSASAIFAFASWQYNKVDTSNGNMAAVLTEWEFAPEPPIEPGQTITVDENGNVYIDDERRDDVDVSYPSGEEPKTAGGTITYDIGVVDGELVVTNYTATNLSSSWSTLFGANSEATLPQAIVVNGEQYPIIGLSQPLSLEIDRPLLTSATSILNIPEGYRYVCNNAFQGVTCGRSATLTVSLPSSLEYLGNNAFKLDVRNLTTNITYAGTKEQFNALVEASKAEFGSDYVFFTGASGNVTVNCSDGEAVYNRNGVYQG